MDIRWRFDQTETDWNDLSELYKIAPLGLKPADDLELVFTNSRFKCFVYEDNRLVGVGRALSDGLDCSYICDIAVHPDYQGAGPGKEIV